MLNQYHPCFVWQPEVKTSAEGAAVPIHIFIRGKRQAKIQSSQHHPRHLPVALRKSKG